MKKSHLNVITNTDGSTTLEWDWRQLERDVLVAVRNYEYRDLSKHQLELVGRTLGIELDRRKRQEDLVEELIQFELNK